MNEVYSIGEIIKSSQLVTWENPLLWASRFFERVVQRAVCCGQSSLGLIVIWHKATATVRQTPQTPGTVSVSSEAPKSRNPASCKITFHVAETTVGTTVGSYSKF